MQSALGGLRNQMESEMALIDLLYAAPDEAVHMVQEAIRAVARGDLATASQQMGFAAEVSATEDEWFRAAGAAADELRSKSK